MPMHSIYIAFKGIDKPTPIHFIVSIVLIVNQPFLPVFYLETKVSIVFIVSTKCKMTSHTKSMSRNEVILCQHLIVY